MGNISSTQGGKVLKEPWRTFKFNDAWSPEFRAHMIADIKSFTTYGKLDYANILLLGPVQAGKSSFINSIASIDIGRIAMPALVGAGGETFTTRMQQYIFKKAIGGPFRLIDTMGLEKVEGKGFNVGDVLFLMEGHIKPTYKFKLEKPINRQSDPEYILKPELKDNPLCSVITIDSTLIDTGSVTAATRDRLVELRTRIKNEEVPVVILLTKIDIICEREKIDITKIYTYSKIKDLVQKAHDIFGVPEMLIFPVQNYRTETGLHCKKSEICISGMATSSRHSLPTQPKSREEKTAWL